MTITAATLADVILPLYFERDGVLMSPIFSIAIRAGAHHYAVSVAHALDPRDEMLSVWTGVHPAVALAHDMKTAARLLAEVPQAAWATAFILDETADLLALPLPDYTGPALDVMHDLHTGDVGLLERALIAFLDYAPDSEDVLHKVSDGLAGLVSAETAERCVLSMQGGNGLSGAPVFVAHPTGLRWFGIYTGTSRTTPLTHPLVSECASVTKVAAFVRGLSI